MSDAPSQAGYSILRLREFRLLITARFLWSLGQQIFNIAMSLLIFDRTRSPLALGLIGLASFLPGLCLTLVSGPIADRFDRRLITIVCFVIASGASLGVLTIGPGIDVFWLYFAVVLLGAARAFASPATAALLPNVVPLSELGNALAWNNSLGQIANISGPMFGGFLYAAGRMAPFACCVAFFCVAAGLMIAMAPRPPLRGRRVDWQSLIAGYHYIWSRSVILGALTLDLVAVILGGATALLPIYAIEVFHSGPEAVGVLRAANSLGALAAAVIIAIRPLQRKTGRLMFVSVAIFGAATVGFGLSTHIAPAIIFLFVAGAADQISVVIRQILVQIQTPDEMRGRVSAAFSIIVDASNQIGQFESGIVARLAGTVASVVLGGVGSILAAALWMKWFPSLLDYDRLE